jgi:hypothetical protein
MPRKEVRDLIRKYVDPFRITKGKGFRLTDFDPGDTCGLQLDKGEAAEVLQRGTAWLAEEQDMLYAQDRWSLLLVFQAMDAAGKDSTIKHVMSASILRGARCPRSSSPRELGPRRLAGPGREAWANQRFQSAGAWRCGLMGVLGYVTGGHNRVHPA